jgi:hypothetical protein
MKAFQKMLQKGFYITAFLVPEEKSQKLWLKNTLSKINYLLLLLTDVIEISVKQY